MDYRCPDARIVGTAELKDYRLLFKGSKSGNYLTVEPAEGYSVPLAVWAVTEDDEWNLDRYEGCPTFYYKQELPISVTGPSGRSVQKNAFIYIMREERPVGIPSHQYMVTCMEGYRNFGFDLQVLFRAYKESEEESE